MHRLFHRNVEPYGQCELVAFDNSETFWVYVGCKEKRGAFEYAYRFPFKSLNAANHALRTWRGEIIYIAGIPRMSSSATKKSIL